jgi:hypothetical protein
MTRTIPLIIPLLLATGCKKTDEDVSAQHASCSELDERGIKNRMNDVTSNKQDVFGLDGHCLEATSIITYGEVIGVRFAPVTDEGESAPFHIQTFFVPPDSDQILEIQAPERLSNPDCISVEAGFFCGHVNDVVNTPNIDVDLRGKAGSLDLDLINTTSGGLRTYEGFLEWTVWGVDSTSTPDVYDEPSLLMTGEMVLTVG